MYEHPQFTYDRYAQEMRRLDQRIEMLRVIEERREADAEHGSNPRRGWFGLRRTRDAKPRAQTPAISPSAGSPASAISR